MPDRIASAIATGLGAGLMPFAPGTFGAFEGLLLFLCLYSILSRSLLSDLSILVIFVIANLLVFIAGVWASGATCRITGKSDPGSIVIDEVSGQLIALLPLSLGPNIRGLIVGFVLFRLFDIFKPFPIRRLERLHGGFGVMADDALAGIYAAAVLWPVQSYGLV